MDQPQEAKPIEVHQPTDEIKPLELQATAQATVLRYSTWTLVKFIASFNRDEKLLNTFGLICCFLVGAEEPANAILFAKSTIALALPSGQYTQLLSQVAFWAWMYFLLAIVQWLAFSTQGAVLAISSERISRRVKTATFRKIMSQDIEYFEKPTARPGALISLVSSDTNKMCAMTGSEMGLLLTAATTLLAAVIIGLTFGWKLGLVCIATVPILLYSGYMNSKVLSNNADKTNAGVLAAANLAVEAISEIRTVASLTKEAEVLAQYDQALSELSRESWKTTAFVSLFHAISQSLGFLWMGLAFWYGGTLLARGEYSPLQFFVTYTAIIQAASYTGLLLSLTGNVSDAIHSAGRLKDLWSSKIAIERRDAESFDDVVAVDDVQKI